MGNVMPRLIAASLFSLLLLTGTVASAKEAGASTSSEAPSTSDGGGRSDTDDGFKPRTLIGDEALHWGGFGSPVLKVTSIDGSGAIFMGGRGAALLNHTLAFGGGGYALVAGQGERSLYYGGPAVNLVFFSEKLVHFDVGVLVGWGGTSIGEAPTRPLFVVEPEANLELNVAKNFRIALGVSYRYVTERGDFGAAARGLGGVSGNLAFRFGNF